MRKERSWHVADDDSLAEHKAQRRPRGKIRLLVANTLKGTVVAPLLACNPKGDYFPDTESLTNTTGPAMETEGNTSTTSGADDTTTTGATSTTGTATTETSTSGTDSGGSSGTDSGGTGGTDSGDGSGSGSDGTTGGAAAPAPKPDEAEADAKTGAAPAPSAKLGAKPR